MQEFSFRRARSLPKMNENATLVEFLPLEKDFCRSSSKKLRKLWLAKDSAASRDELYDNK